MPIIKSLICSISEIPSRITNVLRGGHYERENGMCVMEAASYIAGEKHTAAPQCVDSQITQAMIVLNDHNTQSYRDTVLKPLIPKIIGTRDVACKAKNAGVRTAMHRWLHLDYLPTVKDPKIKKAIKNFEWSNHRALTAVLPQHIAIAVALAAASTLPKNNFAAICAAVGRDIAPRLIEYYADALHVGQKIKVVTVPVAGYDPFTKEAPC
jgi:hypothetical protein